MSTTNHKTTIFFASCIISFAIHLGGSISPQKVYSEPVKTWLKGRTCEPDRENPPAALCNFQAESTEACKNQTIANVSFYCDDYIVPQSCLVDPNWECHSEKSGCGKKRDCATGDVVMEGTSEVLCDNEVNKCEHRLIEEL
jgi:hypothetical protein